jgi:hypothetical protein
LPVPLQATFADERVLIMDVNDVTEVGIAGLLALAQATPRRIAAASAGVSEDHLHWQPAPDEWSALTILNHLRACEEVWMHSVHAMLAHAAPRLQEIHPRQWIKHVNPYTSFTFALSLEVFTLRRGALLLTLNALPVETWARECIIERKTHTIYSHVRRMVMHESGHCDQIEALLKPV